jgi:transcription termination/antitermination protein NusA
MNGELLSIIETMEREKGVNREVFFQAVESALASASRKTYGGTSEDVEVKIDRKTGSIKIYQDGKQVKEHHFGRIAAQTAKQVIIQKIREAERESIFGEYEKRIGELVSGTVHRIERRHIIVDLGRTEAVVPPQEQSPRERYSQGDRIRAHILDVRMTNRGPQIILSRAHPLLVKKIFEMEVPEIHEGIVEIKGVSREAGDRTKIAVSSTDEKVDAVGACVGMRGQRVKNVVRELRGEKIDIVRHSDEIQTFIANALSPIEIADIKIYRNSKKARVSVKDDQLPQAIGRKGQNMRLASHLVGWEIEVQGSRPRIEVPITDLSGVGAKTAGALKEAGFNEVQDISDASVEAICKVKGVGPKTAEKIYQAAKKVSEQRSTKASDLLFKKPDEGKQEEKKETK